MNYGNTECEGLNCDEVLGCANGTIYNDNAMQAVRYDLFIRDGSGTSIYGGNFTMIYVNNNSCAPVVVDMSEGTSVSEDSNEKKNDNNCNHGINNNANNNGSLEGSNVAW